MVWRAQLRTFLGVAMATIKWYAYGVGYLYYPTGYGIEESGDGVPDNLAAAYPHMYAIVTGATGAVTWSLRWVGEGGLGPVSSVGGPFIEDGFAVGEANAHPFKHDPIVWAPSNTDAFGVGPPTFVLGTAYVTAKEDGADIPGELFVTYTGDTSYPNVAWGGGSGGSSTLFWTDFQNSYETP